MPTAMEVKRQLDELEDLNDSMVRDIVMGTVPNSSTAFKYPLAKAVKVMAQHVLGLSMPRHLHMLVDHCCGGPARAAFMYRGSGKSVTVTTCRGLVEILRNPEIRILVASRTGYMAEGFTGKMKQTIESNDRFLRAFGDWVGRSNWGSKQWTVGRRKGQYIEGTVTPIGVGGSVVSRHYELHLMDDLVDNNNTRTEHQRAEMMLWDDLALKPTLEPDGAQQVLGTRYHPRDLYSKMIAEFGKENVLSLPAISEDEWGADMVPWPERHSFEWLDEKRMKMAPQAWAGQYQQDVTQMVGKIIREEWLQYFVSGDQGKPVLKICTADLSASEKDVKGNSFFAMVELWVDCDGHGWVVDAFRKRGIAFDDQVDKIKTWNEEKKPHWFGIESNQFQGWMGSHLARKHGMFNVIKMEPESDKTLRTNTHLAGFALQKKLHIRKDLYDLIDEVVMFDGAGGSANDDFVDCLVYAVQIATMIGFRGAAGQVSVGVPDDEGRMGSAHGDDESMLNKEW